VDWKTVCSSKEVGGLGVRKIREFNLTLLGKWGWRLLEDTESLWFRVLSARYGVEGGRMKGGGVRLHYGGVIRMPYVGMSGLTPMLVAQWEIGNKRFSSLMFGWVRCHLEKGLALYMTCRCLKTNLCLICVS